MARSRSSSPPLLPLLAGAALLALVGGGVWWFLTEDPPAAEGPGAVVVAPDDPGPGTEPEIPEAPEAAPDRQPEPVPERPRVGEVLGRLVDHQRVAVRQGRIELLEGQPLGLGEGTGLARLGPAVDVDEEGRFHVKDVPATGELVLRARGETFATTLAGPFLVADGQRLDVGVLEVEPGLSFRGRISDRLGKAIAGARVALYDHLGAVTRGDPQRLVLTDEEGRYAIGHVRPGPFTVVAGAEGFASASRTHAQPLDPVNNLELNLTLYPGFELIGQVLAPEPEGGPAADVELTLCPVGPYRVPASTRTDDQGRFRFSDLGPGAWRLDTDPVGALPLSLDVPDVTAADELLIRLQRAGTLAGTVRRPDGRPVSAFDLQLRRSTKQGLIGEPVGGPRRIRDQEGRWLVEDLAGGWYRPEVWARGHAVTLGPHVLVRKGQAVTGLEVRLQPAAVLRGRVLDDLGQPIAGVRVSLHTNRTARSDVLRGQQDQASWYGSTRTDRDGAFALENVTAQTYQVSISHPGYPRDYRDDVLVPAGDEIELEPFVLDRPAALSGFVVDRAGQPLRGAEVHLGGGRNQASHRAVTDAEGRYRFELLASGGYRIQALRKDAAPLNVLSDSIERLRQAVEARKASGTTELPVDLTLVPGQELTLTVTADG